MVHEVEQIIKPAVRIGRRPTVKFGLNLRYPPALADQVRWSADIHRRVCRHDSIHPSHSLLPPLAM